MDARLGRSALTSSPLSKDKIKEKREEKEREGSGKPVKNDVPVYYGMKEHASIDVEEWAGVDDSAITGIRARHELLSICGDQEHAHQENAAGDVCG